MGSTKATSFALIQEDYFSAVHPKIRPVCPSQSDLREVPDAVVAMSKPGLTCRGAVEAQYFKVSQSL